MSSDSSPGVGARQSLTFAHLTDPHLTSPVGAGLGELCNKRALSYLSWNRRRRFLHDPRVLETLVADLRASGASHLAITGDLTQLGLPAECREAQAWLRRLAPAEHVSLVPGNHDRLTAAPWEQTVGLWSEFMGSDPGRERQSGANPFPSLRVRGPVAFVGLSSAVPTAPLLATGAVGKAQRDRLRGMLEATGQRGLFRVILIHHPPVPGAYKWRKRLRDAGDISAAIGSTGAELVLHGHTHRNVRNFLTGPEGRPVPVIGLASASSTESRPDRAARYALWTITRRADGSFAVACRSRRRDADSGAYVDDEDWEPMAAA